MNKKKVALSVAAIMVAGYLGTVALVDNFDRDLHAKQMPQQFNGSTLAKQAYRVMTDNGCQYCHSAGTPMPFYAAVPGVHQLMELDVKLGLKHFDLKPVLADMADNQPVSITALAKLQAVISDGSMPPHRFTALHWRSSLSDQEQQIMQSWIKQSREQHYPNPAAAPAHKDEFVQPIQTVFHVNPAKAKLGEVLYHDTRLSGDNTVACSTCHGLNTGGVDHLVTSTGIHGHKGPINAPTVYNAVFNIHQFWDGRAADLQAQAGGPPMNPKEMGSDNWQQIINKLQSDRTMVNAFAHIYPDGITANNITDAIAEFEKTLTTPNSRFDLYLKGDDSAMTAQEKHGFALFKEYHCDTCHSGQAMGGQSFEIMGVDGDYFATRTELTQVDNGRFNVSGNAADMHRFKVPTLRNVALTEPYFHDASAKTLDQAVVQMGKYQSGVNLTPTEVADITAFLKTLTGQYQGKQL